MPSASRIQQACPGFSLGWPRFSAPLKSSPKRYGGMFFPGVLPVSQGMLLPALRFCSSFPPQRLLRADSSSSRWETAKLRRLMRKRHTTGFPERRASQGGFPVWMEKPPGIPARTWICWLSSPERRWRDFHALKVLPDDPQCFNDIWGWTDPVTGVEYALLARVDGVAFFDLSDPESPSFVGMLPMTPGSQSQLLARHKGRERSCRHCGRLCRSARHAGIRSFATSGCDGFSGDL